MARKGNFSEAKKHIEIAIDRAPEQATFLSNYGSLLHTMGDNQAAIKTIKKSLKIDKKLLQSYYSLGIIYTDLDEVDKAIENYNKALEVDNNASAVHNNLANLFQNKIQSH